MDLRQSRPRSRYRDSEEGEEEMIDRKIKCKIWYLVFSFLIVSVFANYSYASTIIEGTIIGKSFFPIGKGYKWSGGSLVFLSYASGGNNKNDQRADEVVFVIKNKNNEKIPIAFYGASARIMVSTFEIKDKIEWVWGDFYSPYILPDGLKIP